MQHTERFGFPETNDPTLQQQYSVRHWVYVKHKPFGTIQAGIWWTRVFDSQTPHKDTTERKLSCCPALQQFLLQSDCRILSSSGQWSTWRTFIGNSQIHVVQNNSKRFISELMTEHSTHKRWRIFSRATINVTLISTSVSSVPCCAPWRTHPLPEIIRRSWIQVAQRQYIPEPNRSNLTNPQ